MAIRRSPHRGGIGTYSTCPLANEELLRLRGAQSSQFDPTPEVGFGARGRSSAALKRQRPPCALTAIECAPSSLRLVRSEFPDDRHPVPRALWPTASQGRFP